MCYITLLNWSLFARKNRLSVLMNYPHFTYWLCLHFLFCNSTVVIMLEFHQFIYSGDFTDSWQCLHFIFFYTLLLLSTILNIYSTGVYYYSRGFRLIGSSSNTNNFQYNLCIFHSYITFFIPLIKLLWIHF